MRNINSFSYTQYWRSSYLPNPSQGVLVLCEMHSVRSRIWTRVAVSIPPTTITITPRAPLFFSPPLGQDMTQGQFFKRSLTGFNSEFSFSLTSCLTKAEEPSLPYYLPIAGGRIFGFIPFRSRIWTRVAVSISCDDNHYTTGTSHNTYVYIRF